MRQPGALIFLVMLANLTSCQAPQQAGPPLSFDYDTAKAHEIAPHRRTIPVPGIQYGSSTQVQLTLVASKAGDVISATAEGDGAAMRQWPNIKSEIMAWKFSPFLSNEVPTAAQVEEYVDLVPPERLPRAHVAAPPLRPDSRIVIELRRSGCYGSCPSYSVTLRPDTIEFNGRGFVVVSGTHNAPVDAQKVRALAGKFIASDFYSFENEYRAGVTDNPTYVLSISIDGHQKQLIDYVGSWVGMPAIVSQLEDDVDAIAETARWIKGADGLVTALKGEGFEFRSAEAQTILKRASANQQSRTVHELIESGVPLSPLPSPAADELSSFEFGPKTGILTSASDSPAILNELIRAGVSKNDHEDKNNALRGAASAGNLESVQLLIAYGADPNADLRTADEKEHPDRDAYKMNGPGSILIQAAYSGNPAVVREILKYHPNLEARGFRQQTALFFAGETRSADKPGARVECVRLLVHAGANVNARDYDGDTPLHQIYLTDVEEELLKLGADVNARNNEGETPIFTNVDDDCIAIFIAHGADLTIRNKAGKSIMQAAKREGPAREKALRKALAQIQRH